MRYLLGIDLGTSSVKALVLDTAQGQIAAAAGEEYPLYTPAPNRAEQHPEDYWQATIRAVRRALHQAGTTEIAAIGLSGQMHGTLLLDAAQQPLGAAIIWADARTAAEPARLQARFPRFAEVAGTLPAAGFMVCTLAWLAEHEPERLRAARQVLLPKDYLRLQLTGEVATDVSDAAATGAFDVAQAAWSDELLAAVGLPRALFPPVLPSSAIAGTLRPAAAAALGLPALIPVVTGCADQPAQAIGSGLVRVGLASVTVGTGGQVNVPLRPGADGRLPTDPRLHVFNHAAPDLWYVLGAILAAGLALRWLRNRLGLADQPDAYERLSALAAAVPPGADGLLFLPYLTGERTPHMDPQARGGFIGLSYHHDTGHLARAVMEGVAFALRQTLEISLGLAGQVERVIGAGGGVESRVWRQILADCFHLPLQKAQMHEQAATGAAILAGVGVGRYASLAEACEQLVRYDAPVLPSAQATHYDQLYPQFTALYPALKPHMHALVASTQGRE